MLMNTNNDIKVNGVVYRQQFRKCGKPGCKCNTGEGHGPYWYAYDGNSVVRYVGILLPKEIKARAALIKSSGSMLKAIKTKISKRRDDAYREYSLANQELRTVQMLEAGEHADSKMLTKLGLGQFNGHEER